MSYYNASIYYQSLRHEERNSPLYRIIIIRPSFPQLLHRFNSYSRDLSDTSFHRVTAGFFDFSKSGAHLLLLRSLLHDLQSASPPPRTAPRRPRWGVFAFSIAGQQSGGARGGYWFGSWDNPRSRIAGAAEAGRRRSPDMSRLQRGGLFGAQTAHRFDLRRAAAESVGLEYLGFAGRGRISPDSTWRDPPRRSRCGRLLSPAAAIDHVLAALSSERWPLPSMRGRCTGAQPLPARRTGLAVSARGLVC